MKEYDFIVIGTGSAMEIVTAISRQNSGAKFAVIDKDEPGGICLTRGCIPSKILLYPAELVRTIEKAGEFGISVKLKKLDFSGVMERMKALISIDINAMRQGLTQSKNIDFYTQPAEFTAPYQLKVGDEIITAKTFFLCTGSKPVIPSIAGLEEVGYLTSDTLLNIRQLPTSIVVVGGGYIAAEYGHFLSAMGSEVTIIGRNPQFIPEEEPEVSEIARRELQKHLRLILNCEVVKAESTGKNRKKLTAIMRDTKEKVNVEAEEILIASGRGSNADILHPERGGIEVDKNGWITVNDHLETSQPNIWTLGDADGHYLFKHVANYEALIVYYNAIEKKNIKTDYHAVPHAVFTCPEIASVGLKEKEAIEHYGKLNLLIGIQRYEDTAKGLAIGAKDFFAKVILESTTLRILGAHIIGPSASILIQEIVDLMYTSTQNAEPIIRGMHIHPALSEVVQRAFGNLMPVDQYHHMIEEHYGIPTHV